MIICGTGHRPQYCPCKFNEQHPWLLDLKESLKKQIAIQQPSIIISGMAIGFDTWLAQVALEMSVPLHAYVPFEGQGGRWPEKSIREYRRILDESEKVVMCSEEYSRDVFLKRDRMMVDASDTVWSLLSPEAKSGGTFYTVQYAINEQKMIYNFWPIDAIPL